MQIVWLINYISLQICNKKAKGDNLKQILQGIKFLHNCGRVLAILGPEVILLTETRRVKISMLHLSVAP